MSYEKDKLDSYVTSASLTTALAPYATSASVSAAITAAVGAIDLSAYVSSNSLSVSVTTDRLTVRGKASVSATLSAAAVTVSGKPVGAVILGYENLTGQTQVGFSGSWSDIAFMEFTAAYLISGSATSSLQLFTDGGTTPVLSVTTPTSLGVPNGFIEIDGRIVGGNGAARKVSRLSVRYGATGQSDFSVTANSGVLNCLRFIQSRSMSSGMAVLIGYKSQ